MTLTAEQRAEVRTERALSPQVSRVVDYHVDDVGEVWPCGRGLHRRFAARERQVWRP